MTTWKPVILLLGVMTTSLLAERDTELVREEPGPLLVSPARDVGDPTVMPTRTKLPEFRELVNAGEFEERFVRAHHRAIASLYPKNHPVTGVAITYVEPKKEGEKAGLDQWAVITSIDDKPVTCLLDLHAVLDDGQAHVLGVVDEKDQPGKVEIPAIRPLGIRIQSHWHLNMASQHTSKKNPKWDELLMVAIATRRSEPDLAETALRKAVEAGCDDWTVPFVAFDIAMNELRFDDALKLAPLVLESVPPEFKAVAAERVAQPAILSYRLPFAIDTLSVHRGANKRVAELKTWADSISKLPPLPRTNPASYVDKLEARDLFDNATMLDGGPRLQQTWDTTSKMNSRKFTMSVPTRRKSHFNIGPAIKDGEARVTFKIIPADDKPGFLRQVYIGLIDATKPELAFIGAVELRYPRNGNISLGDQPKIPLTLSLDWEKEHTVRLIFHNRDVEFLVDDTRVYFGPMTLPRDTRKVGFCIDIEGIKLPITDIEWIEYGEATPEVISAPPKGKEEEKL